MCLIKFFVILFFAKFFAYLNMTNSGFSFTQIPHHFGCRFWGIINVKFWMINVKFYKKLCHIIFHKFLSISRCVRPVTYASWLSKKVPCFLQLQLLRTFVYLVGGYRFILFCISIVSGLESRGLSKLFIVNAKGLLKLILHFFLTYSYFLHSFFEFFITIYNRHICSLYHSLVHFTISCTQWRHLCVVRLHHICEAPRHFLFTFSRPLCLKLE